MTEIEQALLSLEKQYESKCLRCGKCCGRDTDPCVHLKKGEDGRYFCEIYERRFGWHSTVSGKRFRCVPIREVKRDGYLPPGCGYR